MSFWDLEAFIAEEQSTQFCFTQDAEGMDFLDISKGIIGVVPADAPLHTPNWIVSTLHTYVFKSSGEVIKVLVSKNYDKQYQGSHFNSVEGQNPAKLEDINLRQKSEYYFEIYQNIQKVLQNHPELISCEQMKNILSARSSAIIERASTHQTQSKAESRFHGYIESQRALFRIMRSKTKQYQYWQCKRKQ